MVKFHVRNELHPNKVSQWFTETGSDAVWKSCGQRKDGSSTSSLNL